jgi:hypothetical protein
VIHGSERNERSAAVCRECSLVPPVRQTNRSETRDRAADDRRQLLLEPRGVGANGGELFSGQAVGDRQLLIDHWTDHGPALDTATIDLVAGRPNDLRIEYYDVGGATVAKLAWSSPTTPLGTVPTTALAPAAAAATAWGRQ